MAVVDLDHHGSRGAISSTWHRPAARPPAGAASPPTALASTRPVPKVSGSQPLPDHARDPGDQSSAHPCPTCNGPMSRDDTGLTSQLPNYLTLRQID